MPTPEEEVVEQPISEEAAKPLEVDLSEDAGGDEPEARADRPSKKERREEFRRETLREVGEERARREALERQVAQLQGQLHGFVAAQPQQQRQAPQEEAGDPEVEGLWDQQQGIMQQMRNTPNMTEAEVTRLTKQFRQLDNKRRAKEAQHAVRTAMAQVPAGASQEDIDGRILAAEFPDVINDPEKRLRAQAEMVALMKTGKPYGLATAREAAAKVRGPGRRVPPANPADAAKFTSQSSQAGGSGGGNQKFAPSRLQLSAARAYTAHRQDLSDEDRVRVWAKDVGKKHGLI